MPELPVFTAKNFDREIKESDRPVLVYVTTRWCRPGRDLAPIVEQAAEEIADKIKVGTLDADVEQEVIRNHQVRTLPTLLLFKAGKLSDRITGRFTKLQLMGRVSAFLTNPSGG
ncbi:MAG: thiol reductase thioredoxin [Candidatus Latescibacteria bacterium]|nr:thiol reductase thioredoxin [Candidatus Latescibacterota bacterium]